jgi:hypothetical protein
METMKNMGGMMKNDYKGGFKKAATKTAQCLKCGKPMSKCDCGGK